MTPKRLLLFIAAGTVAVGALGAGIGLVVIGTGVGLELLDRLRNPVSCENCILREGLWCRCRPVVERLNPTLTPEAPGRISLRDAWRICGGSFYRGRDR